MKTTLALAAMTILLCAGDANAQYNKAAGVSAPRRAVRVQVKDDLGRSVSKTVYRRIEQRDKYGNAAGSNYDLAVDGAFKGQTVVVLHFYTQGFDFSLPKKALAQKGFSVYRWRNGAPTAVQLAAALKKASQLWIISSDRRHLNKKHLKVIKKFFDSGRGIYIWGDNQPYYADANYVAQHLFGGKMLGNLRGDKVVNLQKKSRKVGVRPNHLLSTGLEHLYEGITIATIQPNQSLKPLVYGSAGNLVTAFYDRGGKRAILDGGFTRLYVNWDTAGTARYVKNAAAWLANVERFGKKVARK